MVPLNIADYRDAGPRRLLVTFAAAARDRIEDRLPLVGVPALVVRGTGTTWCPRSGPNRSPGCCPRDGL